jgi:integrase
VGATLEEAEHLLRVREVVAHCARTAHCTHHTRCVHNRGCSRIVGFSRLAGWTRNSINHVRSLASGIFSYAVAKRVLPSNPFNGAVITESIEESEPTYAYSLAEIGGMLDAFAGDLRAQAVIVLGFFCGLRPGEIRGCLWEDYNGNTLYVRQSVWRKHTTAPKTAASVREVPIGSPTSDILDGLRESEGNRTEGLILKGANGRALNLDMYGRKTLRPVLEAAGIEWRGYYSLRRGAATLIGEQERDAFGAAGLLGHKHVSTTNEHYAKITRTATVRAVQTLSDSYATLATPKQLRAGQGS